MNISVIEALLEKFYEGNSSLQEEKMLRDFFRGNDVPPHLKLHQPLFIFYGEEQQNKLNDEDFDQKLTAQFENEADETPVIFIHPVRTRFMFITGIAASILLLIGLFFTFQIDVFKNKSVQANQADQEIAYANVSEALMMVSGNLNNGLKQVKRLHMVDEALRNMQLFNKFYQVETIIINPDEIINQSPKSK